jgi:predicted nucleotidyltransferase
MEFDVKARTIYSVRHGSHAYGTNIEGSDVDVKGVCIPPTEYYLGFYKTFDQHESKDPYDQVVYGLRKFAKLAADCNPNIIEVLFVDPVDFLHVDAFGQFLHGMRHMFLSKKAKHTFSGYAHSQLKRIRTHRSWLLKPPPAAPKREDFGLPAERQVSKSEMGAFLDAEEKDLLGASNLVLAPGVMELLQREKTYGIAKREWEQYQNWVHSRNPKRAELEARYGYDTKHAGHLVRLMRMCREILMTGEVIVKRPDADEIKAVRAGAWEYDQLIDYAAWLENQCEEAEALSTLPRSPDWKAIDGMIIGLTQDYLKHHP